MQLGDLIAQLEDEATADEALIALGDLGLLTRVAATAAQESMTRGEFVSVCVGRFAAQSSDEQWLTLIGQMSRAPDPGQLFVRRAIESTLSEMETIEARTRPPSPARVTSRVPIC